MVCLRQRPCSRDILISVIDAENFAPELFREEDRSRPFATRHVQNPAGGTQAKHPPEQTRHLQAARMKRVAQQKPGQVAFVQCGATLFNMLVLQGNTDCLVVCSHEITVAGRCRQARRQKRPPALL